MFAIQNAVCGEMYDPVLADFAFQNRIAAGFEIERRHRRSLWRKPRDPLSFGAAETKPHEFPGTYTGRSCGRCGQRLRLLRQPGILGAKDRVSEYGERLL